MADDKTPLHHQPNRRIGRSAALAAALGLSLSLSACETTRATTPEDEPAKEEAESSPDKMKEEVEEPVEEEDANTAPVDEGTIQPAVYGGPPIDDPIPPKPAPTPDDGGE